MEGKYIIHGPKLVDTLQNCSLGQQLYNSLSQYEHLPRALIDAETSKCISYKTLLEKSFRLAEALRKSNIGQDDVVAVFSGNTKEYFLPIIASMFLGSIVTTLSHFYAEGEILHAVGISKPIVIFCSKTTLKVILPIKQKIQFVKKIVVLDTVEEIDGCENLEDFIKNNSSPSDITNFKPAAVDTSTKTAFIFYSSGTSGLPKGVMITHKNINFLLAHSRDPRFNEQLEAGTQTILGVLPFFHSFGFYIGFSSIILGKMIVVINSFNPAVFLAAIEKYRITLLYLVPVLVSFLAKSPLVKKYNLLSVEAIVCAGAPLSLNIQQFLVKRLNIKVFQLHYGLTEALGIIQFSLKQERLGSCGKIIANSSVKVIDIITKVPLGANQQGEICLKSDVIMKGYVGNERETKEAIDGDGWLRTGDLGYYDKHGFFFIVDRLKDVIKYKGFQYLWNSEQYQLFQMENNKHILRGPKPHIELPNESVGQQVHQRLNQHQNLPVAWTDAVSGRNVSFKIILETTCRLAESLNNYGIRENNVVEIFIENNIEYFYSVVAAAYLGIILTTFSYHYGEQEILHTANISKPKVIFCSKTTLQILLQLKDQMKFVQKIVVIDSVDKHNDWENLQDFINNNCKNWDVANFKSKEIDTVPPAELESLLLTHPKVADVGVVGAPDERAGEVAVAFVVTRPGQTLTGDEIKNYVAERISPQKQLHGGVRFVKDIPKTGVGKIQRNRLRELVNLSQNSKL